MIPAMISILQILAQAAFDDAPAAPRPAPAPHRLSFSDLQQGLRETNEGNPNDHGFQLALLTVVAIVAVVALILHLRQRRKTAGPPNSLRRLGWELSRQVRFPWGTRVLLWWVARNAGVPVATLLLSGECFEEAVEQWSARPTFAPAREWGRQRLLSLHGMLFGAATQAR